MTHDSWLITHDLGFNFVWFSIFWSSVSSVQVKRHTGANCAKRYKTTHYSDKWSSLAKLLPMLRFTSLSLEISRLIVISAFQFTQMTALSLYLTCRSLEKSILYHIKHLYLFIYLAPVSKYLFLFLNVLKCFYSFYLFFFSNIFSYYFLIPQSIMIYTAMKGWDWEFSWKSGGFWWRYIILHFALLPTSVCQTHVV